MDEVVRSEIADGVAVITIARPEARNALNRAVLRALPQAMLQADANEAVAAIVLTGADPAFCAGLDLKEVGAGRLIGDAEARRAGTSGSPWPVLRKPLIGAINGAAVTGGLELALQCDFLVASERARFADTHTRVGILPGWGLTVLLPQAVGLRRAIEMSMTGNYLDADEALRLGLVNHVVPHDDLLTVAVSLATDMAGNDRAACQELLASYKRTAAGTLAEGHVSEQEVSRAWARRTFDPAEVERRRVGIVERGRAQGRSGPSEGASTRNEESGLGPEQGAQQR